MRTNLDLCILLRPTGVLRLRPTLVDSEVAAESLNPGDDAFSGGDSQTGYQRPSGSSRCLIRV